MPAIFAPRTIPPEPDFLPLPPENAALRAQLFGSDERCRGQVYRLRFPDGYTCAKCSYREFDWCPRYLMQCRSCGEKSSLLTGTLFEHTKKTLLLWFKAIDYLRRTATSARRLGIHFHLNYKTAWLWVHKIRSAMQRAITRVLPGDVDPLTPQPRMTRNRLLAEWREYGGLVMGWRRVPETPSHGCERLDRHDLATLDPNDDLSILDPRTGPEARSRSFYPIKRWESELGPRPRDSHWAEKLKRGLRGARQTAIVEKHLEKYVDEFAFFYNRRTLDAWTIFRDLLLEVLDAPPLTYAQLVAKGPLRPWLEFNVEYPERS